MKSLKENANELDMMFLTGRLMNGKVPEYINFSIGKAKPGVFFPVRYRSSEYLFRELADEIAKFGHPTKIIAPENRGDMYIYKEGKIKNTAHTQSFYSLKTSISFSNDYGPLNR